MNLIKKDNDGIKYFIYVISQNKQFQSKICRRRGPLRPQRRAYRSKHAGESTSTNTKTQRQLELKENWELERCQACCKQN